MLMWAAQQAAAQQQLQFSLSGMDCELPSIDQQMQAKKAAMSHLRTYIDRCGGSLPGDWSCGMRFRITTRRNGNVGRTTDNFYYSPCGKTFRTHKQVAEFLGLEPQPVHPPRSQAQHPAFEVVVLSVKTASAAGKVNNAGEHVEPVSGHTACQETLLSAEPIQQVGNKLGCSTATHKSVALPAASSCASEVCTVLPEQQRMQWQQQMAPAAVRKHTKNMLAAKYSCTSNGESHRSLGTCSVSSRGRLSAAAAGHTAESALAPSLHQQSAQVPGPAIKSQLGSEQRQKRRHMSAAQQVQLTAGPTDSACSQSTGNTNMAAPPPKRKKCPQQPAWRANLRALATAQYAAMLAEKQKANSSSGNETGNPCSSSSTTTTT